MTQSSSPASSRRDPGGSSAVPVMRRVLVLSSLVAAIVAVGGGAIGFVVASTPGLISAIIAAVLALVFSGVTAVSVIVASRLDPGYFLVFVLGAWVLKLVVVIAALAVLRHQPFIDGPVLYFAMLATIVGQLGVDVVVVVRSRLGYASDVRLPEPESDRSDDDGAASSETRSTPGHD